MRSLVLTGVARVSGECVVERGTIDVLGVLRKMPSQGHGQIDIFAVRHAGLIRSQRDNATKNPVAFALIAPE